jgi:anti-anti-sigma factor
VEVETVGEVTLVTLPTRVDTTSAGGVEAEFKGLLEQGARRLVADFGGNEYVSSAGLRVFLSVLKALERDGGRMVLCSMQPFVADVFEISGFSGLFTIVPTRDEALAALA